MRDKLDNYKIYDSKKHTLLNEMIMDENYIKIIKDFKNEKSKREEIIKKFHHVFRYEKKYQFLDLCRALESHDIHWVKHCPKMTGNNIGYYVEEAAIEKLFNIYQSNNSLEEVIPKVAIVNELYSAGLNSTNVGKTLSIVEMSEIICNHSEMIDGFQEGCDVVNLVDNMANKEKNNKGNAYSFVTKYLSFALRSRGIDEIVITDTKVRNGMAIYNDRDKTYEAKEYGKHYEEVKSLREELKGISFKQIDSFFWILGKVFSNN